MRPPLVRIGRPHREMPPNMLAGGQWAVAGNELNIACALSPSIRWTCPLGAKRRSLLIQPSQCPAGRRFQTECGRELAPNGGEKNRRIQNAEASIYRRRRQGCGHSAPLPAWLRWKRRILGGRDRRSRCVALHARKVQRARFATVIDKRTGREHLRAKAIGFFQVGLEPKHFKKFTSPQAQATGTGPANNADAKALCRSLFPGGGHRA